MDNLSQQSQSNSRCDKYSFWTWHLFSL